MKYVYMYVVTNNSRMNKTKYKTILNENIRCTKEENEGMEIHLYEIHNISIFRNIKKLFYKVMHVLIAYISS